MENDKTIRVGIIGMGPVGQILAVHLQEAGYQVAICDRGKEKMNLIRHQGIRLEGKVKKHVYFSSVHTSVGELLATGPGILVFAVKSHHMDSLLDDPAFAESAEYCVLSAQNGIDVERSLSEAFGESRTLRMVVNFAGNLHAPNVVNVTFFNPPNYVASVDDSREDVAAWWTAALNSTGLDTETLNSFAINAKIWEKTILNSSLSALCGISRLTIREAMGFPDTKDIVEQIIVEAIEVARAEDIRFGQNFVKLCMRYLKRAGNHFPSLAVDLLNNRETEIDYFNGKIIEYGRKHYIRTPLNLTFNNLVKAASYRNTLAKMQEKAQNETIVDI